MSVEATSFADAEIAIATAIKTAMPSRYVSNVTPAPIPDGTVIVTYSGGGRRDWGEASANLGINVYATTEKACRDLVLEVQDVLAALSNDTIDRIAVPAGGGTSIPRQTPPFQRYFAVTAYLRGQTAL